MLLLSNLWLQGSEIVTRSSTVRSRLSKKKRKEKYSFHNQSTSSYPIVTGFSFSYKYGIAPSCDVQFNSLMGINMVSIDEKDASVEDTEARTLPT
ncbi:hypothetical protein YC2023_109715 [Brassica napus]